MKDLNIIYIYNLKNEIKDFKKDIIKDCLKTRKNSNYSFQIFTKHHKKLYSIFIKNCRKRLKKFKIIDKETKIWSYFTDKNYFQDGEFHDHVRTSTICGVLYLETIENCGIYFKYNNKIIYLEPKPYDLLIFPNFLKHKPVASKNKKRVSLNFELICSESTDKIFNIKHSSATFNK